MTKFSENEWIEKGKEVLFIEANTINLQAKKLSVEFRQTCQTIINNKGHLIIAGIGKSGHIGEKLAATFASTGTPAFYIHPTEAGHGDLGMITKNDILLTLSYSGESTEIMTMIPIVQSMGVKVIAITGHPQSSMAKAADIHLPIYIEKEACPLGLAPTSSSTATLALGDAIAITIMQARDFSQDDFARSHPFGRLGRRLTTKVSDIMHREKELPINQPSDNVEQALFQITDKRLGMTLVTDANQHLLGIYTDGDLRRTLTQHDNPLKIDLESVMTREPKFTQANCRAADALALMQDKKITVLPVIENNILVGVLHIHDLIAAGVA